MPWNELIIGVAGMLVGGVVVAFVAYRRVRTEPSSPLPEPSEAGVLGSEREDIIQAVHAGSEVYVPTGRDGEFLVIDDGRHDHRGAQMVPGDVLRSVTGGLSKSIDGVLDAAKATGRLVMVDADTASAIKAGTMVKDSSGSVVAVVRGAGGRFEHVARLTPAAGKAVGTAMAASNVLGAVSTQMQMASIESKLKSIVQSTERLERLADRELAASIRATGRLVEEVYEPSRGAESLPSESWSQLAPHFHTVLRDQEMAAGNVRDLVNKAAEDPEGFWLGKRQSGLSDVKRDIEEKLELLRLADLNVVRLNLVRLWHYTVSSPELAPHFADLARQELEVQENRERDILRGFMANLRQHGDLSRIGRTIHWHRASDFSDAVEEIARIEPVPRLGLGRAPLDADQPSSA